MVAIGLCANSALQTAVAVLTVGYILAQLPSNMLMTRVRPNIYLPAAALVWSAVSAATVGCTSAGSLWAVQFVLGIVEAPLFPGVCSTFPYHHGPTPCLSAADERIGGV